MMFKTILIATFGVALMIILATPRIINGEASKPFAGVRSQAGSIHVDCLDHDPPPL
jgi:hypothetical protein